MTGKSLKWKCVNGCGACCRLEPADRTEALEALDKSQKQQYLDMVNSDGWCKYFDTSLKTCKIYEDRPDFCNVKSLTKLYGIPSEYGNSFAIQCCKQHIRSLYGGKSKILKSFNRNLKE